jgi:glycosyltransferase involved in cell wall biosynthesis
MSWPKMKNSKKIAIVVQRAGKEVMGGSEKYAYEMASVLSEYFNTEIITTTARDHVTWRNYYRANEVALSENLRIRRFKVDFERGEYWQKLDRIINHSISLNDFHNLDSERRVQIIENLSRFPLGFCEEWLKYEGPYSSSLLNYLEEHSDAYDHYIFMTYLYPTTYFGIDRVDNIEKLFIIPTFHDELPAYNPIFSKYKKLKHLFLSESEKDIAEKNIYRDKVKSEIIGFGIKDCYESVPMFAETGDEYVLYMGRLEVAKGVGQLYDFFTRLNKKKKKLLLYTIGDGDMKHFENESIVYKGFVSDSEKLSLVRNALAFVHPSPFESLSIALLEAFMMGTPAIVNRQSTVLHKHIMESKAGFAYSNFPEFETAINRITTDKQLRYRLGNNGREYFLKYYSLASYKKTLRNLLQPETTTFSEER